MKRLQPVLWISFALLMADACGGDVQPVEDVVELEHAAVLGGKYFVFPNERGFRLFEKTDKGFESKIFAPGERFYSILEDLNTPRILETQEGEVLYIRDVSIQDMDVKVTNKFYRIQGNQLIEMPIVQQNP